MEEKVKNAACDLCCLVNKKKVRLPFTPEARKYEVLGIFPLEEEDWYLEIRESEEETNRFFNSDDGELPDIYQAREIWRNLSTINQHLHLIDGAVEVSGAYFVNGRDGRNWITLIHKRKHEFSIDVYQDEDTAITRKIGWLD